MSSKTYSSLLIILLYPIGYTYSLYISYTTFKILHKILCTMISSIDLSQQKHRTVDLFFNETYNLY